MSQRLNKSNRSAIVTRALAVAFGQERAALALREQELARACYDDLFKPTTQAALAEVPEGWLYKTNGLCLNHAGQRHTLALSEALPVPYERHWDTVGVVSRADLRDALDLLLADMADLKERRRRAAAALTGLLSSVATVERLREVWPEGEPYYREVAGAAPAAALPAIRIAEINALLHLETASIAAS